MREAISGAADFSWQTLVAPACVELFSGVGRLSTEMNENDCACIPIDIAYGVKHNMLHSPNERCFFNLLRKRLIRFVWIGLHCSSFSVARKLDGLGPKPLRDDHMYIMGLPDLSRSDAKLVSNGNLLLLMAVRTIRLCNQLGIPWALENPLSSRVWNTPVIKTLVDEIVPAFIDLDFCQFGELWKKPTRIMYKGIDFSPLGLRCQTCEGRCSRTGKKHVTLQGKDAWGQFLTLKAQPYPFDLCNLVASLTARALRE
jgi:hypothetical protein